MHESYQPVISRSGRCRDATKKRQAKLLMAHGSHLVNERDSHKRKFEDMSGVEQQVLEDFEADRSAKRYTKECGKRLPVFRGNML